MENDQVLIEDLELSDYDIYKEAMYEGKPYTGTAVEDDEGIHTEWTFVDGNGHGRWFSVYPDGRLFEETILEHGDVISERTWNKRGQLTHKMDSSPLLEQDFDDKGNLLKELTDEHLWEYYENGIKKADYDYQASSVTKYDRSGIWIIKGRLTDRYLVLSRENIEFNDDYWIQNHISILMDSYEDTYPFFRIWLMDKPELQADVICAMIDNKDLKLKYDGMILAREIGKKEAIPLIEKQVSIKKCPPSTEHHSYGFTVGYLAEQVLRDLKR